MGLARRNFENRERDKTVKIMQCFSFRFEEVKMMTPDRKPEVKNANADQTFDCEALTKTILAWEVLQKSRMCIGTRTAARIKSERRNAWECRFLDFQEVQRGNIENAKK